MGPTGFDLYTGPYLGGGGDLEEAQVAPEEPRGVAHLAQLCAAQVPTQRPTSA
jgi:hypothetical protein